MKSPQKTTIFDLLSMEINEFTTEDLNTIFNLFNTLVYKENDKRVLCLDDETIISLPEYGTLYSIILKALDFYKNDIKISAKNELKTDFKKLLDIK